MIALVPLDALDKTVFLIPFVVERISEFARQHMDEVDPDTWTRTIITRLAGGDPSLLVLAMVGAKGNWVCFCVEFWSAISAQ